MTNITYIEVFHTMHGRHIHKPCNNLTYVDSSSGNEISLQSRFSSLSRIKEAEGKKKHLIRVKVRYDLEWVNKTCNRIKLLTSFRIFLARTPASRLRQAPPARVSRTASNPGPRAGAGGGWPGRRCRREAARPAGAKVIPMVNGWVSQLFLRWPWHRSSSFLWSPKNLFPWSRQRETERREEGIL